MDRKTYDIEETNVRFFAVMCHRSSLQKKYLQISKEIAFVNKHEIKRVV